MGILAKNAEFHIETENFRFSANTCRARRKIFCSQKIPEYIEAFVVFGKPQNYWYRYLIGPQNIFYIENFYKIHKFFE